MRTLTRVCATASDPLGGPDETSCLTCPPSPACSSPTATSHLSCIKRKTSTYCPHICCGRGRLPHWCSGCCPALSWINTAAICRLADAVMFVFQGESNLLSFYPRRPLSLSLPLPLSPSLRQRWGWYRCTGHCSYHLRKTRTFWGGLISRITVSYSSCFGTFL